MNLRQNIRAQLADVADFLGEEAESESAPPQLIWGERRQAMQDVAQFMRSFIIPRIPEELGQRHPVEPSNGNGFTPASHTPNIAPFESDLPRRPAVEVIRGTGFMAPAPANDLEAGVNRGGDSALPRDEGDRAALDDNR